MSSQKWYEPYISCWGSEEPSQFPEALVRTIPIESGKTRLLDIGCGSGIIGIFSLIEKKARFVTFMDIESKWLDIARCNLDIKIREGAIKQPQVKLLSASGFAEILPEQVAQHDLLAFNPPQLPYTYVSEETRREIEGDPIEKRFRYGGPDGLDIAREFFKWYRSLPKPKPDAVILLSSFLGRKLIGEVISSHGLRQIGEPRETRARLRDMFWEQANTLSQSTVQRGDRSLELDGAVWHKRLLTIRVADE